MSDASVAAALRSAANLVVIEAPAGCGKTYQGAEYAREVVGTLDGGRALILTHTHAACDVFAQRTADVRARAEIRTIDSLIAEIGSTYHRALELPSDAGAWARTVDNGYDILARRVADLLRASPMIGRALAQRYPIVICDEHQDCCEHRHDLSIALLDAGTKVRVFADPMQDIFGTTRAGAQARQDRWTAFKARADAFEELDVPHRWRRTNVELGRWVLHARRELDAGRQVDLRGELPQGLQVLEAENVSQHPLRYQVNQAHGRAIRNHVAAAPSALVVASQNETVRAIRSAVLFGFPIWEGHTRNELSKLVAACGQHAGDAGSLSAAATDFVRSISVGFTAGFRDGVANEVAARCASARRGRPATLQSLARLILDDPSHRGVARMLRRLWELIETDPQFGEIRVDYRREFQEAFRLEDHDDPNDAFAEAARRRTFSRPTPPQKSISTIHKAKGLEFDHVVVMPCDRRHFSDTRQARCLLYVAMSRAMRSLTFVVSSATPSPLFLL